MAPCYNRAVSENDHTSLFRWVLTALAVVLALLAGFTGGFYLGGEHLGATIRGEDLVHEVQGLLAVHYLDELPPQSTQQEGMVEGLLATLDDPYTTYLSPADHELENQQLEGRYGGIGAFLSSVNGVFVLVPFPDGPADRAGLQEGDVLVQVDDLMIASETSTSEVTAALRGPVGSEVDITVERAGHDGRPVIKVEREELPLPSVTSYTYPTDDRIGVVVLSNFGEGTLAEIRAAFADLKARGARAFILDLRGNPGGLIDTAIDVADLLLREGTIMTEVGKDGNQRRYRATASADDLAAPLVVLVDGGTASAAEVLAAALQHHGRAPIYGSATFGKGSVQAIHPLQNGASLHITTARWYGPDGSQLDGQGIRPDAITEPRGHGADPPMRRALERLLDELESNP